MRFAYSTLACPGRRLEETLELGVREKRWHPEIDEPEKALLQHLRLLEIWAAELAAATEQPKRS